MIETITEEQKEYIKKIIDETRENYINFNVQDTKIVRETIDALYERVGKNPPIIVYGKNPLELKIKKAILKQIVLNETPNFKELNIGRKTYALFSAELQSELSSDTLKLLKENAASDLKEDLKFYNGLFWRYWCTFYNIGKYLGVNLNDEKLTLLNNFSMHCPIIAPYESICFVSELPTKTHFFNKVLHRDGGSCIEFKFTSEETKFNVFRLNGIKVPEKLVMTPSPALTMEYFRELKSNGNADVCTEYIKKFGKERLLSEYGKLVDSYENYPQDYDDNWLSKSEYKLYDMSAIYTKHPYAPHLYMKNQTTNTYHLEAVSPKCKNLLEALDEREQKKYSDYKTIFIA